MTFIVDEKIEEYAGKHTTEPATLFKELEKATHASMTAPQMLTGKLEGRFLKLFVEAIKAKRVLEIGMFTGYGTLSMAEGLPEDGVIWSCEIDPKTIQFAEEFFSRSPHKKKIRVLTGPALVSLKTLETNSFDFIFIDADKVNYPAYYEEGLRLLKKGSFMAIDNVLWSGKVLHPEDEDTKAIHWLNEKIAKDSRVEAVLLTVRDGIQLVRRRE